MNDLVPKVNEVQISPYRPQLTPLEVRGQVALIQQVMSQVMKDREHYGKIPGCGDKPTLLKAGAEKLAFTFRLAPSYEEIPGSREDPDFIAYKIRCSLVHIPTGECHGTGLGACNSRERKYAKQPPWDIQNTLYKMACKRALVAAVLNATAASDIFTQDLEDDPEKYARQAQTQNDKPPVQRKSDSQGQVLANDDFISDAQAKRLYAIYKGSGVTDSQIRDYILREFGTVSSREIKRSDYEKICAWAESQKQPDRAPGTEG